jgi:hypothetical protein
LLYSAQGFQVSGPVDAVKGTVLTEPMAKAIKAASVSFLYKPQGGAQAVFRYVYEKMILFKRGSDFA